MAGKNLFKAWHRFIQTNFNSFKPSAPNLHKERKYEHIEIQKDFEEIEKKRQLQRLTLIEYKKKLKKQLLEQQLAISKAAELLEGTDKKLADEVRKASETQKFEEHKSYKEFSKTMEESKRRISHTTEGQTISTKPEDIELELSKLTSDLEQIRSTKEQLETVEKEMEELEPGYVLVTDMDKKFVLNSLTYYEFMIRNLQGVSVHPETLKSMEIVHYHVEHNLPVRRELLYEVVPEIFETELGELTQLERERILAKRPRFINADDAIVRAIEETPEERTKDLDELEQLKKEEFDFMEFVYAKAGEFAIKHSEFLGDRLIAGFPSTEDVLENIEAKDESKRTPEEQVIYTDLQELKRINDDYAELINLNKAKAFAIQRQAFVPDFVKQNEKLHKAWLEKWEQLMTNSIDFAESILIPDNSSSYESKLDKVLKEQRAHDINELIQQSQEEYKMKVASNEPPKQIDRNQKNTDLLKKLEVLSGAMNQIPTKRKVKTRNLEHFQSHLGHSESSEEGKILIHEYTKVLYLNNQDPAKYNLIFWAEHFNIVPQKLRNIFNFVTFALPDPNNSKDIGRVLRFIYDNSTLTEEQKASLGN